MSKKHWWIYTDKREKNSMEKNPPRVSLSTKNLTWTDQGLNLACAVMGRQLITCVMAKPDYLQIMS